MRFFAVFTCLFSSVLAFSVDTKPANRMLQICYISMNNEKEFHLTKNFVDRIQKLAGRNVVQVKEFLEKGDRPERILEKMIETNEACDGLVISGHHTGSFGGTRASGVLSVEFMERVSCQKDKAKWFESVQSLWLQGCRTLGAPGEMGENNVNLAEFHANRVNAVRNEDGLEQNRFQLAQEFSDLLDAQTPYATRFMKSFPQARLYGWTRTAPGEKKGSERSLPFHIHNMAIRAGSADIKKKIKNPFDANLTPDQAQIYLDALLKLLQQPKQAEEITASLTAWEDHGKPNYRIGTIGFDNDDLASMPPLFGNGDAALPQSRSLECKLRNGETAEETIENVQEILKDPRLIALTFYTLKDVISNDGEGSSEYRSIIIDQMKSNQNFTTFLQDKIKNIHASLVRRLEYYGLLNLVDAKQALNFAKELQKKVEGELLKVGKENDYEEHDYKVKIVEESIKSELLKARDIQNLFEKTKDKNLAQEFIHTISSDRQNLPDNKLAELLKAAYDADRYLAPEILSILSQVNFWHPTFSLIVEAAIAHRVADSRKLLGSSYLPKSYLNEIADIVVSELPRVEISVYANDKLYKVSGLVDIIANKRVNEDIRRKSTKYLIDFFALTVEKASYYTFYHFFSDLLRNRFGEKIKAAQLSKSEKTKLLQLASQSFAKVGSRLERWEFSQALLFMYHVGGQEQALEIAKQEIKTEAGIEKVQYFIDNITKNEEFIGFDTTEFIKKLLQRRSLMGQFQAFDILLKSRVDKKFFYEVVDQLITKTQSKFMPLYMLVNVNRTKYLSEESKKHLTERIKSKMSNDAISDPFFQMVVGLINPYYMKVSSQFVLAKIKSDPHNSQLRAFYVWVWLSERPQLSQIPPQLDAYLKHLDDEALGTIFWTDDIINKIDFVTDIADEITGKISAEIRREIYMKVIELNNVTPEKLGELKSKFRSEIGFLGKFPYKDMIIKKIDEKLSEIYN